MKPKITPTISLDEQILELTRQRCQVYDTLGRADGKLIRWMELQEKINELIRKRDHDG